MTARVMQEIKRLQEEGPSADLTDRAKETARRGYETALKQNDYWLGRLQTIKMYDRDPGEILTRNKRIDAVTPQVLQEVFKQYFPRRPLDGRHAHAHADAGLKPCATFLTAVASPAVAQAFRPTFSSALPASGMHR